MREEGEGEAQPKEIQVEFAVEIPLGVYNKLSSPFDTPIPARTKSSGMLGET